MKKPLFEIWLWRRLGGQGALANIYFYELFANLRSRWLGGYTIMLFALSSLLLYAGVAQPAQAVASLLNLVLLAVPLFTLLFGGISFNESLPFLEMVLVRNVTRRQAFYGKWLGQATGLLIAYFVGLGASLLLFLPSGGRDVPPYGGAMTALFFSGAMLNLIFLTVSYFIANAIRRRELLLGANLLAWFASYLLYDMLMVGVGLVFGDYPLEIPVLVFLFLNPLDLTRIYMLMQLDIAALFEFSTALFSSVFGPDIGVWVLATGLAIWLIIPLWLAARLFHRRDL